MAKEIKVQTPKGGKGFKLSPLEDGIILDRVPLKKCIKVLRILGMINDEFDLLFEGLATFGTNFNSQKVGKKDMLKFENKFLTKEELSKLALLCYDAKMPIKVTVVKNNEKVDNFEVQLPDIIIGVLRCYNPKCICSVESHTVKSKFYVVSKKPLILKCHYCERTMTAEEIKLF